MSMRQINTASYKAKALAVQRRNYAMDNDALARPSDWWCSWSSRMPAYYGTDIQAKHGGENYEKCNN